MGMGIPEDLRDALDSAVSKLMSRSGRTAVAFSGGLDSGIVAAMASVHGPVKLYTVGTAGSFDPETSGELAAEIGRAHV